MSRVHICRVENNLQHLVDHAFDSFGLEKRLSKGTRVVIKPNIVSDVPEYITNGCNTDKRVIKAVLEYLSKFDVQIYLVESDTGTSVKGRRLEIALQHMGIYELQKEYRFHISNLSNDETIEVTIPGAKILKRIKLAKTFLNSDLIINIPKLKTHKIATMTCSLKNMFGIIPDPLRVKYHHDIHQVIADLNLLFWDKMFVVVDGLRGMEGNGPIYGSPVDMNLLMFSDNPLDADIAAAHLMGLDPGEIKHLVLFNEQYGGRDMPQVEVTGEKIEDVRRIFERAKPNWFVKFETEMVRHPIMVKILFSDFVRRNITYHLNPILKKLRGGSGSWYDR